MTELGFRLFCRGMRRNLQKLGSTWRPGQKRPNGKGSEVFRIFKKVWMPLLLVVVISLREALTTTGLAGSRRPTLAG